MKKPAFTLIETLIAITLVVTVMTAITGLILLTMRSNQRNIHSLQAAAYAQEGLEVMRYLRDSNWLQNYVWTGLGQDSFDLENKETMTLHLINDKGNCPPCWSFGSEEILQNEDGLEFKRSIILNTVENPNDPLDKRDGALEVTAHIEWEERGLPRELKVSTYLTDWQ